MLSHDNSNKGTYPSLRSLSPPLSLHLRNRQLPYMKTTRECSLRFTATLSPECWKTFLLVFKRLFSITSVPIDCLKIILVARDSLRLSTDTEIGELHTIAKVAEEQVAQTILRRIRSLFRHERTYRSFLRALTDSGTIISGSFLLHCIYLETEKLTFGDIDLFVAGRGRKEMSAFMLDYCETVTKNYPPILSYSHWNGDSFQAMHQTGGRSFIEDVFDLVLSSRWTSEHVKLQLVTCKAEPQKFIEAHSDFPCTKFTFDGQRVHLPDESIVDILERRIPMPTLCLDSKEAKGEDNIPDVRRITAYYRWAKYLERGFTTYFPKVDREEFKIRYRGYDGHMVMWLRKTGYITVKPKEDEMIINIDRFLGVGERGEDLPYHLFCRVQLHP